MARTTDTDPLSNFNFYLIDVPIAGVIPVAFPFKIGQNASQGQLLSFKSITIPTMELQIKEIQEGNWPFKHNVPLGFVNTGQVTIASAVTSLSMDFFLWFHQAVYGKFGPRRNFTIAHTRQDQTIPRRIILLEGCIPVSWKPSSDFDATSSDISIEELTMAVNRVEVTPGVPI